MRGMLLRVIPGLLLIVLSLVVAPGVALAASVPAGGDGTPVAGAGSAAGAVGQAGAGSAAGAVGQAGAGSVGSAGPGSVGHIGQGLPAAGSVVPASGPQAGQGPPPLMSESFVTDHGHLGGTNRCYGKTCNNQDPGAMGCNKGKMDIYPFKVLDANKKVIALGNNVYSYACNANWAEGRLDTVGADVPQGHNIVVSIWTTDSSGAIHSSCFPASSGDAVCDTNGYNGATGWPAFSNMVDGSLPAQAGVQAIGPDGTVSYGYKQE